MIQPPRSPRSVLLVDDEPQIREILRELLEERGCKVFEAQNGREAFHVCQTEKVEVLITDLLMPEQEGIETIQRFRNAYPQMKIIAISGAPAVYLDVAKALGADATFRKPLHLTSISRLVGRMLELDPAI